MTKVLRPGAGVVACVLLSLGSAAGASGPVATAAGPPAHAVARANPEPSADAEDFSLTVSPTRLVVGPDDHDGEDQTVDVINGGEDALSVTVQKRGFTGRRDGSLAFEDDAPYSAASWLTLDSSTFVVPAGGTKTIDVAIALPNEPEPGDHQVALVFLVMAGETEDNVRINRGIAIPVYVAVPGPIDESAWITDLDAPAFATGGPVPLTATIDSTGTVHRDFRGEHRLNVTGSGTAPAFADFTIARGGARDISTTWDPPLACICHPRVTVTNPDGSVGAISARVIVLPLRLMAGIAAVILVVGLLSWFRRRRFRAHVAAAAAALVGPVSSGGA